MDSLIQYLVPSPVLIHWKKLSDLLPHIHAIETGFHQSAMNWRVPELDHVAVYLVGCYPFKNWA